MIPVARICSLVALVVVLVPSILYAFGRVELPSVHNVILAGTILWFVATPLWMTGQLPPDADQVEI